MGKRPIEDDSNEGEGNNSSGIDKAAARKARKKAKKEKKSSKKSKKKKKTTKVENDNDNDAEVEHDAKSGGHTTKIAGLPPAFYNSDDNDENTNTSQDRSNNNNTNEEQEKATETEVVDEATTSDEAAEQKLDGVDKGEDKEGEASVGEANDDGDVPSKKKRKRKRKRKNKVDDENTTEHDETAATIMVAKPSSLVDDTIFVEGIPFDCDVGTVREFFEAKNNITDIVDVRLPTWQDSGRLRGFGHIKFGSSESYTKALQLNGQYIGKRYLTIQPANKTIQSGNRSGKSIEDPALVQKPPKDCCTIYVNNLPYDATETDIYTAFQKHTPNVRIVETVDNTTDTKGNGGGQFDEKEFGGVRIAKNSVTRQSKGFAYIDFVNHKECQKLMTAAVTKNVMVGGRIVRLDYDTGRIRGSFR